MRIISGTHKGRLIKVPSGLQLRPTTDMAREGLFNILNNILTYSEITVLDLFSGTGSLSYEFASRGTETVHAIELKSRQAAFIRKAALDLGFSGLEVFQLDVRKFIKRSGNSYDLVFADPPYNLDWLESIPELVLSGSILSDNGLFILEHPGSYNFSHHCYFSQHRKYGSVNFTFFKKPLNL